MTRTSYLTRCHDSEPDNARQREIDDIQQALAAKVQARKDYQKWYQKRYAVTTDARREKQKLYQREYRLKTKGVKEVI